MKIISANRLTDGVVVYFVAEGSWTAEMDQAKCFDSDAELEAALQIAKADEKRNIIVEPFAVPVKEVDVSDVTIKDAKIKKALEAVSLRNIIRAKGPTIDFLPRPEHSVRS